MKYTNYKITREQIRTTKRTFVCEKMGESEAEVRSALEKEMKEQRLSNFSDNGCRTGCVESYVNSNDTILSIDETIKIEEQK